MIRTLVLLACATFANANTDTSTDVAACTSALNTMVTSCASSGLPATPTAASIEGLCDVGINPLSPAGCGYDLGRVALKCPKADEVPVGVTISSADQAIIDGAMMVAECCMKSSSAYTLAAKAIDNDAQESSVACWTGSGASTAWTDDATKQAAIVAAVGPLGAAVAAGTLSVTGPTSTSSGGDNDNGDGASTTMASNATTTKAATAASASDAGKASLAMSVMGVMAGVAMLRA